MRGNAQRDDRPSRWIGRNARPIFRDQVAKLSQFWCIWAAILMGMIRKFVAEFSKYGLYTCHHRTCGKVWRR